MIKLKRAYEAPAEEDGLRILVDRLWPCGVFKDRAEIDMWMKEVAPSPELVAWYGRDPERWDEFRERYWQELQQKEELVQFLARKSRDGTVTFVFRAKDTEHNAALALKEYLDERKAA